MARAIFISLNVMPSNRYSEKELQVFLWILLPYTAGLNAIVLGECNYGSAGAFFIAFGLSSLYLAPTYFIFGLVAVIIKKRFPSNNELFKRIGVMLPVFYTMNVLMLTGLYAAYDYLKPAGCSPVTDNFFWAVAFCCFCSTVVTFLNEAVVNWQKWKASVIETEQLKNAYQKTKLLGLKGQINPHFLFNCFNSLSSLIAEDQDGAEQFLDEMTRVHRYMLRGDDEQLVPVAEELKFARSYLFLLKVRFGNAIQTVIDINDDLHGLYMPPLGMQAILENIIYTNSAEKSSPLKLSITSGKNQLMISNNVQPRTSTDSYSTWEGVENLVTKYRLLHVAQVMIHESSEERVVILPLLKNKQPVA